jgi:hypothetical protein
MADDKKKEHWMEVCELAAKEKDDEKFNQLILEVSRLLKEKEDRFKHRPLVPPDQTGTKRS